MVQEINVDDLDPFNNKGNLNEYFYVLLNDKHRNDVHHHHQIEMDFIVQK